MATLMVLLTTALSAGAHVAGPGVRRSTSRAGAQPGRAATVASPPPVIGAPRTPPRPNLAKRRAQAPAPEPAKTPAAETKPAAPKTKSSPGKKQSFRGPASWYGPDFVGRETASGEVYDPSELTAAHPSLPFGTRIRVTNQLNGRSVVVRVNDRGPFSGRRIVDVSSAAADRLRMKGHGVVPVVIEVL
ncbi:MAG: septal ring lytic transglycosylase RlpA family protein [Nitriliruptorales bacterium]